MSIAFVFPGQGSQSIGMLNSLAQLSSQIEATFAEASEVLGYNLWKLCQEGPPEALNVTTTTQPAMLAAGVATYRVWRERNGAVPQFMAGHSLGEFTALVAAGSIDFKIAVSLVQFRAEAMQNAVPQGQGAMAAILGLEDSDVEAACDEAAQGEIVEAVNFNSPGQVVIAGTAAAVARAIEAASARGAKRAVLLPISVPAHSSLMLPAALKLRERLETTPIAPVQGTEFYGVDVKTRTSPDEIRDGLVRQLHTPVFWAATIRTLIGAGATRIIECGPGKVLTSLNRRIDKNRELKMLALEDRVSLIETLASVQN
ncbi:MAG: ACP S-malonyltransferase [Steroidobacteraceae bacterium]|jgi:[acyl-carrier-protein] S-malonyltransferase